MTGKGSADGVSDGVLEFGGLPKKGINAGERNLAI